MRNIKRIACVESLVKGKIVEGVFNKYYLVGTEEFGVECKLHVTREVFNKVECGDSVVMRYYLNKNEEIVRTDVLHKGECYECKFVRVSDVLKFISSVIMLACVALEMYDCYRKKDVDA